MATSRQQTLPSRGRRRRGGFARSAGTSGKHPSVIAQKVPDVHRAVMSLGGVPCGAVLTLLVCESRSTQGRIRRRQVCRGRAVHSQITSLRPQLSGTPHATVTSRPTRLVTQVTAGRGGCARRAGTSGTPSFKAVEEAAPVAHNAAGAGLAWPMPSRSQAAHSRKCSRPWPRSGTPNATLHLRLKMWQPEAVGKCGGVAPSAAMNGQRPYIAARMVTVVGYAPIGNEHSRSAPPNPGNPCQSAIPRSPPSGIPRATVHSPLRMSLPIVVRPCGGSAIGDTSGRQ
jgi:hypothetical protein